MILRRFLLPVTTLLLGGCSVDPAAGRKPAGGHVITVAISDRLPKHLCHRALFNLETLFRNSFQLLHQESKAAAFLSPEVRVVLPPKWLGTDCANNIPLNQPQLQKPDLYIGDRDPVFGSLPQLIQAGQCGVRGERLQLPFHHLVQADNITSAIEIEMARNLASYLYGVFPIHGFANDTLYPASYRIGEVVLENLGCNNKDQIFCDPGRYDRQSPTKQNLLCNSRSPLEIVQQADKDSHEDSVLHEDNQEAEVIQLDNRSALTADLEVVNSDDDSRKVKADDDLGFEIGQQVQVTPKFRYSIQSTTRYVLILDHTSDMEREWIHLHNALHRFIMEMSVGDEIAVVTYTNTARINLEPTVITEENKPGIHGRIPGRAGSRLDTDRACLECALETASDLLAQSNDDNRHTGSLVVLVTAGSALNNVRQAGKTGGGREDQSRLEFALSRLTRLSSKDSRGSGSKDAANVPLYAITFRSDRPKSSSISSLVMISHFGKLFMLEREGRAKASEEVKGSVANSLVNLHDSFLAIKSDYARLTGTEPTGGSPADSGRRNVGQKFFEEHYTATGGRKRPKQRIEGKLTVEESLRRNLRVMAVADLKEDIEIFELVSPTGKRHRFPIVERGSVYFEFADTTAEAGIWTFMIKLSPTMSTTGKSATEEKAEDDIPRKEMMVTVIAYAEQSSESTVQASVWTDRDGSKMTDLSFDPQDGSIKIFVQLKDGRLPISNADVVAEVNVPSASLTSTSSGPESSSYFSPRFRVRLTDSGSGYPDITAGDGIYTGYLAQFSPDAGFYSLTVHVNDAGGNARVPSLGNGLGSSSQLMLAAAAVSSSAAPANADCCGSAYPIASTIPTPTFNRIVLGPAFYLDRGVPYHIRQGVPAMQDVVPPVRVTDLRVVRAVDGADDVGVTYGYGIEDEGSDSGIRVRLSWTAPGDNFAEGTVDSYRIYAYTNWPRLFDRQAENMSDRFERDSNSLDDSRTDSRMMANETVQRTEIPMPTGLRPVAAGQTQVIDVSVPWADQVFYYGVIGVDREGNAGHLSNLVPVFARAIPTPQPVGSLALGNGGDGHNSTGREGGGVTSSSLPNSVREVFEDNLMVYIISGCITGIAIIILIVIIVSIRISRRKNSARSARSGKKAGESGIGHNNNNNNSHHHQLIKEISSPTLIHSSTNLVGILKDGASHQLSVLPTGGPAAASTGGSLPVLTTSTPAGGKQSAAAAAALLGFGSDYAVYRPSNHTSLSGASPSSAQKAEDAVGSWGAVMTGGGGQTGGTGTGYTNAGFYQSSSDSTLAAAVGGKAGNNTGTIDSGFYRAGEIVDNMAEFFVRPNEASAAGGTVVDYVSYRGFNTTSSASATSPHNDRVSWSTAAGAEPASAKPFESSSIYAGSNDPFSHKSSHSHLIDATDHHSMVGHFHPSSRHHGHHHHHHHQHHDMMMMMVGTTGEASDNATSSTDCDHSSEACSDKNDPTIGIPVSTTTTTFQQLSSSSSSMSSSTRGYQRLAATTLSSSTHNNNHSRLSTTVIDSTNANEGRSSSEATDDDSSGTSGSRNAAAEFHSLIVTSSSGSNNGVGGLLDSTPWGMMSSISVVGGESGRQSDEVSKLSVLSAGPLSLPHSYELDIQERRRRRESFV